MKSDRILTVCVAASFGPCLLVGCGNSDPVKPGPLPALKAPEVPVGMSPEAQQQYLQSRSTPAPSALAASQRAAAEQKSKP